MLALISPPLQLLAVIIEALQAHDAIMQAHPVGSKGHKDQERSKLIRIRYPDKLLQELTQGTLETRKGPKTHTCTIRITDWHKMERD